MISTWEAVLRLISNFIIWGVIVHIILGFFLDPYHPARQFTARIFEPMLEPIRRFLPQNGMIDFSPMVLILLVELVSTMLQGLLNS